MELQPIILAVGNESSGMADLSSSVGRPLIPVGNRPVIWYPVKMLANAGFQEVLVVTQLSMKQSVELALQDIDGIISKVVGVPDDLDYDTADCLIHIKDHIKADMFLLSCDYMTDVPLHRFVDAYRLHNSTVTMMLCPEQKELETVPGVKQKKKGQQKQKDFFGLSSVEDSTHRVLFIINEADLEDDHLPVRPSLLTRFPRIDVRTNLHDPHMYIVKRWVLDYIVNKRTSTSFKSEILPFLIRKQFSKSKKLDATFDDEININNENQKKNIFDYVRTDDESDNVFRMTQSFQGKQQGQISCYAFIYNEGVSLSVNSVSSYVEANRFMAKPECPLRDDSSRVHSSCEVKERSQMDGDTLIGAHTVVDEKCSIKRSVIGRNCKISSMSKIFNCVLMDNVRVMGKCNLQGCVICSDVTVEEGCDLKDCLIGANREIPSGSKLSRELLGDSSAAMMEFE